MNTNGIQAHATIQISGQTSKHYMMFHWELYDVRYVADINVVANQFTWSVE